MNEIIEGILGPLRKHYEDRPKELTLQQPINQHLWKRIKPYTAELAEAAWEAGIVLVWVDVLDTPQKGQPAAKLRASKFPLLVKLRHCDRLLSGVTKQKDTEKRALSWLRTATSLQELSVLQVMVMELEFRTSVQDRIPTELGAWARLAQVLMDNFDERIAEIH